MLMHYQLRVYITEDTSNDAHDALYNKHHVLHIILDIVTHLPQEAVKNIPAGSFVRNKRHQAC